MSISADEKKRIVYSRRLGRRLRTTHRRLLSESLPKRTIALDHGIDNPALLFDPPKPKIWLEIGFGAGEHLATQALSHPSVGLIGCEPYLNGVAQLLQTLEQDQIENVRIVADDARLVIDALPDASVERCFILFPDPWPKRRHNRRRIVSPETLNALARILSDNAILRLASDHRDYIRWMLFHTIRQGSFEWRARGPADWREKPADWPPTRYEKKAAARGVDSVYLEFQRLPRN